MQFYIVRCLWARPLMPICITSIIKIINYKGKYLFLTIELDPGVGC